MYLKLTTDQLTQLLMACSTPAAPVTTPDNSPTSVVLVSSKLPAFINNAKYEAICCRPIVPLYDGTEADLMPFLLHLDIRRQDEGWASAISSVTTPATLVYLLNAYWLAFLPIFPGLFLIVHQQNTAMMALTFYGPSRTTSTVITSPLLTLSEKRFILLTWQIMHMTSKSIYSTLRIIWKWLHLWVPNINSITVFLHIYCVNYVSQRTQSSNATSKICTLIIKRVNCPNTLHSSWSKNVKIKFVSWNTPKFVPRRLLRIPRRFPSPSGRNVRSSYVVAAIVWFYSSRGGLVFVIWVSNSSL